MIYSINYCDMAEQINPLTFARYLRETGWVEIKRKNTSIQLFQLEKENDFFQITIPTDRALSDYKLAMNHAVETLAIAEGKPMEKILLYLLNPCSDILKIRFEKN